MAEQKQYLFENLRKVISLVDQLRDLGLNNYISLPRIAVLGTQSAGKSSLLEQIVGLDFLPRGSGVVTRRPLEMRLVYKSKIQIQAPYAIFEELQGQTFSDFDKVKKTIVQLTDKVAGAKKGIVDKPIILTIFSSSCPDLTIIDLPGITRIPLPGSDQGDDIEKVTKEMAKRYCGDPKTIILCVIAANQDITTSDGLLMARQLDPEGVRTLGVITKIDIMDKGTNAKSLLYGQDVPLKLGYVGVKCRNQEDINNNKTVEKSLQQERKFFSTNPVYSALPSQFYGTQSLTNKLTTVLYQHIRSFLPELTRNIQQQINIREEKLARLGTGLPETDIDKMNYLWKIVNEFTNAFQNSIIGTYEKNLIFQEQREPAGAQIRVILNQLYDQYNNQKITQEYTEKDIQQAILLHEGDSIPGFPSIDAFLALLQPQLHLLQNPATECIQDVLMVLEDIAIKILDQILEQTPALQEDLKDSIISHLHQQRDLSQQRVIDILDSEIGYIFTNDSDYLTKNNTENAGNSSNPKDKKDIKVSSNPLIQQLRERVDDYFTLVLRNSRDTIPKMIGFTLVKGSQDQMQQTLYQAVNRKQQLFRLMSEPTHIVEQRKELKQSVETMKAAIQIIQKDPDLSNFAQSNNDEQIVSNPSEQQGRQIQKQPSKEQSSTHQEKQNHHHQGNSQSSSSSSLSSGSSSHLPVQQQESKTSAQNPKQEPQKNPLPAPSENKNNPTNPSQGLFGVDTTENQGVPSTKPPNSAAAAGLFGVDPSQIQDKKNSNTNNNTLFGDNSKPPSNVSNVPPTHKQTESDLIGNTIDQGVDKAFESKEFQDGLKKGTNQAVTSAVNSAVPIPGFGEAAGQLSEKVVEDPNVQKNLKDGVKEGTKNEVKGGFAGFWNNGKQ